MAAINTALEKADMDQLRGVLKTLGISDSLSETASECGDKGSTDDKPNVSEEDQPPDPETGATGDEQPKPPETPDELAKEQKAGDPLNLVMECVGLLGQHNVRPTQPILEAMVTLPTPEKRTAYARAIAEAAAPAQGSITPRSQAAKPKQEPKPALDLSKKGALADAFRTAPTL
jgi:hypothetical protein